MDWDWPFWTSRQHLMQEFSQRSRVLFVDPPMTYASDYLGARRDPRLRGKLTRLTRGERLREVRENLLVWTPPPTIPFNRVASRFVFDRLLSLNQKVFRTSLRHTLQQLGIRDHVLWVSFNVYYGDAVVGRLSEALSVYHCTDEISGFPGYPRAISAIEARLASRCDMVLATSEVLRDTKAVYNARSYFVPNAADVELFQRTLTWDGPEPADLRVLPSPRAGFVGQVEYRFDGALLQYAAEHMPDWSFALIGPVQPGHPEVEALRRLPNVHFLGLKDPAQLPAYLAGLQVALIPYKIDPLTRGIYPLKVHEYLAAGKPVVATPIPSLEAMGDHVSIADGGPAIVAAIRKAAADDGPELAQRRSEGAAAHTWRARAAQISHIMSHVLEDDTAGAERAGAPRLRLVTSSEAASNRGEGRRDPLGPVQDEPARLPFRTYARLGRDLGLRHPGSPKRLIYRLVGDINLHRRLRCAHVLGVLRELGIQEPEILDVGCGEGGCSFALARELTGSRVTGIDIDETSVAACNRVARHLEAHNVQFEQADVTRLQYCSRFDAAVCIDLLEHVEDDGAVLDCIYRALKPGGHLVVHVPLRHQLQRRVLPTHVEHSVEDHVRDEYVRPEIAAKVTGAGFRLQRLTTTFGLSGELAFELNTLFADSRLSGLAAAATFPLGLALGYLDVATTDQVEGNSLLLVGVKPGPDCGP
jgi:2-polyprenyl-3-methyl-5-hydroxy-6-metoxy-1,4-benzoquinol methylase/glycosyltransferase involved in cell wall biosynthesis